MTGSTKERNDRIVALLCAVDDNGGRAGMAALTTLGVRSWGVSRKTAAEYVDHLLEAEYCDLEGADLLINDAGKRRIMRELKSEPGNGQVKLRPPPSPPPTAVEDAK